MYYFLCFIIVIIITILNMVILRDSYKHVFIKSVEYAVENSINILYTNFVNGPMRVIKK